MRAATSTLEPVEGQDASRRAQLGRRAVLVGMAAFVGVGASGWLGLHSQRRTASAGGWTLQLDFPRVARAGLDVIWRVTVRRDEPFDPAVPLVLAVTGSFFDVFETQGFHPEPDGESRDGRWRYLEFVTADGSDTMVVDFDTYVQPSAQLGRDAEVRLLVEDVERVAVRWTTTLLP
jgi:hypothetical protein